MKKILAILLCSMICLQGVNAFAYIDYKDVSKEYIKVTDLLYDLEIMKGFEGGVFKPEETLTRAEAAAIMVRLIGNEDLVFQNETHFTDVDAEHWASGYINRAQADGIINGMGDGTFDPEGKVTYHQFVKMLVCILGYEPVAQANGGWNGEGYLYAGSSKITGITKNVFGEANEPVTRITAAKLVYNSLEVELLDRNSFSTGIEGMINCFPDYDDEVTILSMYLECELVIGMVKVLEDNNIELTFTRNSKSYNKDDVIILENRFRYINELEGKTITAWIKLGEEKDVFLVGAERKYI